MIGRVPASRGTSANVSEPRVLSTDDDSSVRSMATLLGRRGAGSSAPERSIWPLGGAQAGSSARERSITAEAILVCTAAARASSFLGRFGLLCAARDPFTTFWRLWLVRALRVLRVDQAPQTGLEALSGSAT